MKRRKGEFRKLRGGKKSAFLLLSMWTLLLLVWTILIWNASIAKAAETGLSDTSKNDWRPSFTRVNRAKVIDAPFIDQREKYPTGCESVTAVMALRYFGVEISVEDWIDRYLPKGHAPYTNCLGQYVGCDPRKAFPGDPYSESGWGCYAPVVETAFRKLYRDRKLSGLSVEVVEGTGLEDLCEQYVDSGIPVAVWATIDMEAPLESDVFTIEGTKEEFTWIYPMHCLLLTGHDSDSYYFNDPMAGKNVRYARAEVEQAYAGLGKQAVVFLPEQFQKK